MTRNFVPPTTADPAGPRWYAACEFCGWLQRADTLGAARHQARRHRDRCPDAATVTGKVSFIGDAA